MDDVLGGEADVWRWETAMLCTLVAVVIAALWVFLPQSEEPTSRPTTRDNEASWGIKAGRWIAPQGKALYLEAVERSVEQQGLSLVEKKRRLRKALMARVFLGLGTVIEVEQQQGRHGGTRIANAASMHKLGLLSDSAYAVAVSREAWAAQEFREVKAEAETLEKGWGARIWPMAASLQQQMAGAGLVE